MPDMLLFANPYHVLDAKGRLAGACPMAEPVRPGTVAPARRFIGARHKMTEGSYVEENLEAGIPGRGDTYFVFDVDPVKVIAEGPDEHFYLTRFQHQDLFEATDGVPLAKLATARAEIIADHVAAYGKEPDTSTWAKHFALDAEVEAEMKKLIAAAKANAEAEADKKKAEAEALAKAKEAAAKEAERRSKIPPLVGDEGGK